MFLVTDAIVEMLYLQSAMIQVFHERKVELPNGGSTRIVT